MQPIFSTSAAYDGCSYHFEEYCVARLCPSFIQLSLASNLDLSKLTDDSAGKKSLFLDDGAVKTFGTYKNNEVQMLKIPFFKHEDTD